jgi:hypothetical protein
MLYRAQLRHIAVSADTAQSAWDRGKDHFDVLQWSGDQRFAWIDTTIRGDSMAIAAVGRHVCADQVPCTVHFYAARKSPGFLMPLASAQLAARLAVYRTDSLGMTGQVQIFEHPGRP